ncbi:Presequence protease, mitochondrial [Eumeta japonica]|uniref:Presequence protease, mitochondrial n=1 Tax=Eumeta variegata TaxID=151549 RepID=A0A4C1T7P2_EUMVA|nr:Presequence protease, mitochondrial [Eumeta japonica]
MQKGFDEQHIESVLHNIGLSLKHQSPQFGLGLLFNSTPLWNHEDDTYEDNFKTAELELLKQKIMALDHEKRTKIYENGLKLEEAQRLYQMLIYYPVSRLQMSRKLLNWNPSKW